MRHASADIERLSAFIDTLIGSMTSVQKAVAAERWELVCEQRGWPVVLPPVPLPREFLPGQR